MIHGWIWSESSSYESCWVGHHVGPPLLDSLVVSSLNLLDLSSVKSGGLYPGARGRLLDPVCVLESNFALCGGYWWGCEALEEGSEVRLSPTLCHGNCRL